MAAWYRWQAEDLFLTLRVQPRAGRDEIVGPHGDALKVRITAPPVEGRANAHLVKFIAAAFDVSRRDVELLAGDTGRTKRLRVHAPRVLPANAAIDAAK